MKNISKLLRLSLIALIGMGLIFSSVGCKGDNQGKREPVATKKITSQPKAKKTAAKTKKAPLVAKETKAQAPRTDRLPYDAVGKVDPFQPLFKEEPKPRENRAVKPKKPERPRTPLERLDLGQLRLTAIIFSENQPRAMVEEDSGKGYVLRIGTPIGLERGQVTDIKRDRIVIEFLDTDDFGNSAAKRRELKLRKPPGE